MIINLIHVLDVLKVRFGCVGLNIFSTQPFFIIVHPNHETSMKTNEMKKKIAALLATVLVFFSCSELEQKAPGEMGIYSFSHSDCMNVWKSGQEDDETIHLKADGDSLEIDHVNAIFNCCLDEGLDVEIELVGDSIIVLEFEVVEGQKGLNATKVKRV